MSKTRVTSSSLSMSGANSGATITGLDLIATSSGSPSCAKFLEDVAPVLTYMLNWPIRHGAQQLLQ